MHYNESRILEYYQEQFHGRKAGKLENMDIKSEAGYIKIDIKKLITN